MKENPSYIEGTIGIITTPEAVIVFQEEHEYKPEEHLVKDEPYLGKGTSFAFNGPWRYSKWEPKGPRKNFGNYKPEDCWNGNGKGKEPYTGK